MFVRYDIVVAWLPYTSLVVYTCASNNNANIYVTTYCICVINDNTDIVGVINTDNNKAWYQHQPVIRAQTIVPMYQKHNNNNINTVVNAYTNMIDRNSITTDTSRDITKHINNARNSSACNNAHIRQITITMTIIRTPIMTHTLATAIPNTIT